MTGARQPEGVSPLLRAHHPHRGSRDAVINNEKRLAVAPLIAFDTDEAGDDDSRYGLVSSVFTQDINRAFHFVEEMPTGIVNINDTSNYWELHIPFGGVSGKDSGIGRVGGRYALAAMCDLKTATFTVR